MGLCGSLVLNFSLVSLAETFEREIFSNTLTRGYRRGKKREIGGSCGRLPKTTLTLVDFYNKLGLTTFHAGLARSGGEPSFVLG